MKSDNNNNLALNTESIQNVVNQFTSIQTSNLEKNLNMNSIISLNTANIQNSVNYKLNPRSQGAYGSLFEFLDKIDIMNTENQIIMQNVIDMKKRLDADNKIENIFPVVNTKKIINLFDGRFQKFIDNRVRYHLLAMSNKLIRLFWWKKVNFIF